jgi:hypothetical protein
LAFGGSVNTKLTQNILINDLTGPSSPASIVSYAYKDGIMQYRVIVEKSCRGGYDAYCPVSASFRASGDSLSSALDSLQKQLLCYLHDPQIELDVIIENSESSLFDLSADAPRHMK